MDREEHRFVVYFNEGFPMNASYARTIMPLLIIAMSLAPTLSAEQQGAQHPHIEIAHPQPDAQVSGHVELRLSVTKDGKEHVPAVVYAGLGGPPWVKLSRTGSEWIGTLDSRMVPNQTCDLMIVTDNKRVKAAQSVKVANPLRVFFADLHSHTQYSDGMLLPKVAHDYARHQAKLDVFSLMDHLEQIDDTEWADIRFVAERATEEGKFVSIPGLEWTKKIGHTCIFDPKTRHWPKELPAFYEAVARAGVVVKFNHPGDGSGVFNGMAFSKVGDRALQLMEVRRDKEEQAFIRALDQGWHIAPDGSDDTHSANWGNVRSWTGMLMPGLSRRNVMHALKQRRCYSSLDRNCRLHFSVNDAPMGDIIDLGACRTVELDVWINEPDAHDDIAKVEIFDNGKIIKSKQFGVPSQRWTIDLSSVIGDHYYFAKVTQTDGNMLWSAPVWVRDR